MKRATLRNKMLYLIIDRHGDISKTASLTDSILSNHKDGFIDIIRPNLFGGAVISYEYLADDGSWVMIE